MGKETKRAADAKREPDFHASLILACKELDFVITNEADFRKTIKIKEESNLANENVLNHIFQLILVMNSVKIPQGLKEEMDREFGTVKQPKIMIIDNPTGKHLYPIEYTKEGFVDILYLKVHWRKYSPTWTFAEWMKEYGIHEWMEVNYLEAALPNSFTSIQNEDVQKEMRRNWEKEFRTKEIQFETWYEALSSKTPTVPQPGTTKTGIATSTPVSPPMDFYFMDGYDQVLNNPQQPPPLTSIANSILAKPAEKQEEQHQTTSSSSLDSASAMDRVFNAHVFMGQVPTEERPKFQQLFNIWLGERREEEFIDFTNRIAADEIEQTSTDEVSLSAHFQNMALETDSSSGSQTSYKDSGMENLEQKNEEQWKNFQHRMLIRSPHNKNEENHQAVVAEGNWKEPIKCEMLNSIRPEDFLPNGRFSELFIPRYNYIPPDITTELKFDGERAHAQYYVLWRRLYSCRQQAQEIVSNDWEQYQALAQPAETASPWIHILLNNEIVKSFPFDELDMIQMAEAIKKSKGKQVHVMKARQVYDRFIRPLERLFALDMPLKDRLYYGMLDTDASDDVAAIVFKFAGITTLPMSVSSRFIVEELSRVRHLKVESFVRRNTMDSQINLIHQVNLKETVQRRYNVNSDRPDPIKTLKNLIQDPALAGTAKDDYQEELEALDEAIEDSHEISEILREQIKDNYILVSRTTSEMSKRSCLENISRLKEKLHQSETTNKKWWKEIEALLARRTKSRFNSEDSGNETELEVLSTHSRATMETYLAEWRRTREEFSKERFGIAMLLEKCQQNLKSSKRDIEYRKILIERQVEMDLKMEELRNKIERGEKIAKRLKSDILPKKFDDWDEDEGEWYRQKFGRGNDDRVNKSMSILRKVIHPPPRYASESTDRSSLSSDRSRQHGLLHRQATVQINTDHQLGTVNRRSRSPSSHQQQWESKKKSYPEGRDRNPPSAEEQSKLNYVIAERRKNSKKWNMLPFEQLPEKMVFYDGHNSKGAPKWALKTASILDISNVYNFTTKRDIIDTEDSYLHKITPTNGVNFDTRLEIRMGLTPDKEMPDIVLVYESSVDRATTYKQQAQTPFPFCFLSGLLLQMDTLLTSTFPPTDDDKSRTEMTLWSTDFMETDGKTGRTVFHMQLQLATINGSTGLERMVRIKQTNQDVAHTNIIQFPWVHLPRVHKLWHRFYEDSKQQVAKAKFDFRK